MDTSELSVQCVPKVCEDAPDTGETAGIASHTWDNTIMLQTWFLYSCPVGQAFTGNLTQQLNNTCDLHTADSSVPRWKYNSDHLLPNCIRKSALIITSQQTQLERSSVLRIFMIKESNNS